jgi:hypothetical protein
VELNFHQLDLRYERLRVRQPARERRILASLADAGQHTPIVVVTTAATHVVWMATSASAAYVACTATP